MAAIKDIIILVTPEGIVEPWTNMGKMCEAHNLNTNTVYKYSKISDQLEYEGFVIVRIPVSTKIEKSSPVALKVTLHTEGLEAKLMKAITLLQEVRNG